MKVGIITFSSAHNYGAMLQTYALQETVKNMGFGVEIINFRPKVIDNIYDPFRRKRRNWLDIKYYKHRIDLYTKYRFKIRKFNGFEKFLKENLNTTKPYQTFYQLLDANLSYDLLIAGSDQIWNQEITQGLNPAYFLKFADDKSKKISYGASIGSDTIEKFDLNIFKHYLKNFDSISIRESSALNFIKKLTNKNVDIVVDPTLLQNKEFYEKIKNDNILNELKLKKDDYVFVFTLEHNEEIFKIADEFSKNNGFKVVFNRPVKRFENQVKSVPFVDPKEFLSLIYNAKYIVTNSFHGLIFSILFNKKFITVPNTETPQRSEEIINILNLNDNLFYSFNDFKKIKSNDFNIDYDKVEEKLEILGAKSLEFLKNSLKHEEKSKQELLVSNGIESTIQNYKPSYLDDNDNFKCYGCYACKESCPQKAISMIENDEGFVYPKINNDICNNCNICRKICIFKNENLLNEFKNITNYQRFYAAYDNDPKKREFSSSGGLFLNLSEKIISDGGFVSGVKYNESLEAIHDIGGSMDKCYEFSGSKYLRSNLDNVFPKIKELLLNDKKVLFTGVPCQVAGLKAYLNYIDYKNLFLVEILCHSNPSPKVFKEYINYLETKFLDKVIDFKFKDKTKGWNSPSVLIKFKNGKVIRESGRYNNYNRGFQIGLFPRESCYECEFVNKNRVGDLTIGDFWGIEKFDETMKDDKGVSLIITNTSKGEYLLDQIKQNLILKEKDFKMAFEKNHKYPIVLNRRRYDFFSKFNEMPIDDLLLSFNSVKKRYLKNRKLNKLDKLKIQLKKFFL
ncbi:polysaccharide pyruvyl transferase family protein [Methanobrevibacter curvatus]|uniref:F420H2 dehydrogenase subunit F n=1 Tax=Methanobrevibacter curvatus TaxID=49547 RepID=A0A165ZR88_9EURY|nr:polysaccharide pyruvyl transferase family protein [Methanobrevibacter curvatus]KZX11062.1 F420H2 dehydrogenase subunit F [Methanobrevibacter curvatus]